ncbi:hypothetical protein [Bremerella sp.]|uniref:hypothetical protein n=1 Tax=Bremerella sp. TaxID=2795602 RepID=UPI003919466A
MTLQTIHTLSGLGLGCVLLAWANWSSIRAWLPRLPRISRPRDSNPAALIDAYHTARDACAGNNDLAKRTDQVFKELICQKVLRCEK